MRRSQRSNRLWAVLLSCAFWLPASLSAQGIWTHRTTGRAVSLEFLKPNFDGSSNSAGDFVLFLTGRMPAWERTDVVLELPLSRGSREASAYLPGASETSVGNPYVGVEIKGEGSPSFAEIGIRLPITPDDAPLASLNGVLADWDRQEAFLSKIFTVTIMGNYLSHLPLEHSDLRVRFGPAFWLGKGNVEMLLDYSVQGGYTADRVTLTTGFSGRFIVSESNADLAERTTHQFGAAATFDMGRFSPGVFLRIPLDEHLSEAIDFVLGLNVGFAFD